jgi:predicted phage terminase large subunit-like protein
MTAAPSRSSSAPTTPRYSLTPKQRDIVRVMAGHRHTLVYGGARSGKTFLIVRAICIRALRAPDSRHAILRFRFNAVKASIWHDTLPKVMRLCFPGVKLTDNRQDGFTTFPNGSQIWFGGLDDKERVEKILGQEFITLYLNEASQIPWSSAIVARTRLAQVVPGLVQREFIDLNPAGTVHWTYKQFVQKVDPDSRRPLGNPEDFAWAQINPRDNAANLSPEFLKALEGMPERQRRRFLDGVFVNEVDGALWTLEVLDRCRVEPDDLPDMRRVVVAVDPSGTKGREDARSDDVGIVVAGVGVDGLTYVLDDVTCNLPPAGWARRAIDAYHRWTADAVIYETNFGGEMVRHTLQTADNTVPIREVTASRGKVVRAEPVSALYEKGQVRHAGRFIDLEDQLMNFTTAGYLGEKSPDRADAAVWAITDLSLGAQRTGPGVIDW